MAGMRRVVAICAIGGLFAALVPFCAVSAGPPPIGLKPPPPPPRPVVRVPVVRPSQQLSFWGVGTNFQHSRDEWQYRQQEGSRARSRLPKAQSDDDWKQW
jgi:hypothetical protein